MQFSTITQLMALLAIGAIAAPAPLHGLSGQAAAIDARDIPGMFARDSQAALDKREPKKEKVMLKSGSTGYEREYSYGSDSSKSSSSGSQRKPSQPTTKKPAYPLPRPAGGKAGFPLPKPPKKGGKRDLEAIEQLDKREPKKEKVMLKSGSTGYEREYSYGSDSSKSSSSGSQRKPSQPTTKKPAYPLPRPAGGKAGFPLPKPPKKGGKRDLEATERLDKREPKKDEVPMMRSGSTGFMAPISPPKSSSPSKSYPLPKPPAGSKPGKPVKGDTSYKLPTPPAGSKPGKTYKKGGKRDLGKREPKKDKVPMMRSGSTGFMAPISPPKSSSPSKSYPLPKPPAGSKPSKPVKGGSSYPLPKPPAGSKPGKTYKKGGKRDLEAEEAAWEDIK